MSTSFVSSPIHARLTSLHSLLSAHIQSDSEDLTDVLSALLDLPRDFLLLTLRTYLRTPPTTTARPRVPPQEVPVPDWYLGGSRSWQREEEEEEVGEITPRPVRRAPHVILALELIFRLCGCNGDAGDALLVEEEEDEEEEEKEKRKFLPLSVAWLCLLEVTRFTADPPNLTFLYDHFIQRYINLMVVKKPDSAMVPVPVDRKSWRLISRIIGLIFRKLHHTPDSFPLRFRILRLIWNIPNLRTLSWNKSRDGEHPSVILDAGRASHQPERLVQPNWDNVTQNAATDSAENAAAEVDAEMSRDRYGLLGEFVGHVRKLVEWMEEWRRRVRDETKRRREKKRRRGRSRAAHTRTHTHRRKKVKVSEEGAAPREREREPKPEADLEVVMDVDSICGSDLGQVVCFGTDLGRMPMGRTRALALDEETESEPLGVEPEQQPEEDEGEEEDGDSSPKETEEEEDEEEEASTRNIRMRDVSVRDALEESDARECLAIQLAFSLHYILHLKVQPKPGAPKKKKKVIKKMKKRHGGSGVIEVEVEVEEELPPHLQADKLPPAQRKIVTALLQRCLRVLPKRAKECVRALLAREVDWIEWEQGNGMSTKERCRQDKLPQLPDLVPFDQLGGEDGGEELDPMRGFVKEEQDRLVGRNVGLGMGLLWDSELMVDENLEFHTPDDFIEPYRERVEKKEEPSEATAKIATASESETKPKPKPKTAPGGQSKSSRDDVRDWSVFRLLSRNSRHVAARFLEDGPNAVLRRHFGIEVAPTPSKEEVAAAAAAEAKSVTVFLNQDEGVSVGGPEKVKAESSSSSSPPSGSDAPSASSRKPKPPPPKKAPPASRKKINRPTVPSVSQHRRTGARATPAAPAAASQRRSVNVVKKPGVRGSRDVVVARRRASPPTPKKAEIAPSREDRTRKVRVRTTSPPPRKPVVRKKAPVKKAPPRRAATRASQRAPPASNKGSSRGREPSSRARRAPAPAPAVTGKKRPRRKSRTPSPAAVPPKRRRISPKPATQRGAPARGRRTAPAPGRGRRTKSPPTPVRRDVSVDRGSRRPPQRSGVDNSRERRDVRDSRGASRDVRDGRRRDRRPRDVRDRPRDRRF